MSHSTEFCTEKKTTPDGSENQINATKFQIRLKLKKEIKDGLKQRGCHWNDSESAYTCESKHQEPVAAFLEVEGIKFDQESIHDSYFLLSKGEQAADRINQVKKKVVLDGISHLIYFQRLLKDYNYKWQTDLKPKDFENVSLENFKTISASENERQQEHLKILLAEYNKFQGKRTQEADLREKAELLAASSKEKPAAADASALTQIDPSTWPFTVIGLNYSMEILFSYNGKIMRWPVERLSENRVKAVFGPIAFEFDKIRDAIIYEAHKKGLVDDETPIKSGVWRFCKKWLVISGKKAVTIENGVINELVFPVFNGKLIEFESVGWLDWDVFIESFGRGNLSDVFKPVLTKVLAWNWKDLSMAYYATAFLFLSPFQQAMRWRPWIYLTGSKGTGKSTFFEDILQGIYGSNTERLDKSTAHATAQTIGNSGKLPIFDEFEKHKHIPEILEMAKLFNKGGKKTSGTPGQKANSYELHHMAWFGSIYLPTRLGQDAAQESRMIKLELKKLRDDTPTLDKVDDAEGRKLAGRIIATMICLWDNIEGGAEDMNERRRDIIETFKKNKQDIEIRTVENFMYASSLLNIINASVGDNKRYDVPGWAIRTIEDDGDKILAAILSSIIRIENETHTIRDVLEKARGEQSSFYSNHLVKSGIKITRKGEEPEPFLAIHCDTVSRYLLKDTEFKDLAIQAPLERIEGARSSEQVKGLNRCVLVPYSYLGME